LLPKKGYKRKTSRPVGTTTGDEKQKKRKANQREEATVPRDSMRAKSIRGKRNITGCVKKNPWETLPPEKSQKPKIMKGKDKRPKRGGR